MSGAVRFIAVIAFMLSLATVAGAAAVAAREEGEPDGVGGGPVPVSAEERPDGSAADVSRATALAIAKELSRRVSPELGDAMGRLVERGQPRGANYRRWRDLLARLRARHRVTCLYVMVRLDRRTAGVVLQAAEDPADSDAWLAAYEIEPGMRKAFRGRAANSGDPPFFDPRIRGGAPHVRALAPVRDGDGDVVAIVAVDVEVGDRRVAR